jgi:enamine deaminase RidA (YjgF/YER057c/UK114 family)
MITRLPGSTPTRSRAVIHNGLVFTVATARNKSRSHYEQMCSALAELDAALSECGTSKARILTVTVYITDIMAKPDMNRAWDEWVDLANPPQRACIGAMLEGDDLVEIVVVAAV